MTGQSRPLIVGAPARGGPLAIPGTRTIECERCHAATLFAPSSLKRPEAAFASFVCMGCAHLICADLDEPVEIGPITPEQIAEIAAALSKP